MDKARKKALKSEWRERERQAFLAHLPMPVSELRAMFDMLDIELPRKGCDRSRRITQAWLTSRGHDPEPVFAWLDTQGGFCDCEILANVEEKVDDAARDQGGMTWPFADPENVAVFTVADIVRCRSPILRVCHDEDDGAWQFLTGEPLPEESEWMLITLSELVQIDPSVRLLAKLPFGWKAERSGPSEEWKISPQEREQE